MQFKTIVADPPWTPGLSATWKVPACSKSRPEKYYKTMTLEDICSIEVPSMEQSHLYLWVLNQHVDWGYVVAGKWGFKVWNMLTWAKPGLGTGRFQCNTEHVLVCRKGPRKGNPFGPTYGTHFNWKRGRHSQKPDEFYELVERVSPGPYLELFARKIRTGWVCVGDEVDGTVL